VQDATRLKSEFLANMSHELRTPLNAIIGFAELMHDGKVGPVSAEHRECLSDILGSSRHLLQLINDVLDLSKVEAGKMEFRPEPVDVARVGGEVRDVLRSLTAKKRIELRLEVDPALGPVVVDPGKLKQVLYNYLSNALKFTRDGGRVTLRAGPDGPDRFRVEVEDTGIGIRREDLHRLFAEFQQLDGSTGKAYPGTGLGLALTKRMVEAQGGQVGVDSVPGEGSRFYVTLPRAAGQAASEPEPEPEPRRETPAREGAPAVLVVEDETKERDWLMATLTSAGYAPEVAASGKEALQRASERRFDAITLDLLLADMGGWEVLKAVRAEGPNRETPIIILTVVAERGVAAGFAIHDYLVKPVRSEQLFESLRRAGVLGVGRHVLVVDDDGPARRLMEATLSGLGYASSAAGSAEEGLQHAAADPPAAVILDLLMPGADGFAFLDRFRRTPAGRRTPVIVWTAKELTAADYSALAASAEAVVRKSGRTEMLMEELRACIGGGNGRAPSPSGA
jgi:CheY-like chemotaxis protein